MSERPGDRATGGNDAGRPPLPPSNSSQQYGSRAQPPATTSPSLPRQQQQGIQLPPLPQVTAVTSGSFPAPRLSSLPSILNPATIEENSQNRRRKFDRLETSPTPSLPPLATGSYAGVRGSGYGASPRIPTFGASEQRSKPTLTPTSPAFNAPAGLRYPQPPTGTISAHQTPFPTSPRARPYTYDPAPASGPTGQQLSDAERQRYGLGPAGPTHPYHHTRRGSVGATRRRGHSSSASPQTSYSGFSQAGQTSPAIQYAHSSSMPTLASAYSNGNMMSSTGSVTASAPPNTSNADRQRQLGIPISSATSQNVYQMMTLETTSGTVQLPVDVQAASRVADEKRRRNAGASARFRQRRKEKERESSTTIQKLESKIKALGDDADFYKRERDYFAGLLLQVPGGERHFPRPQSPRHRRSSSILRHGSGSGSGGYASGPEQMMPLSPDQGRNVRRRTASTVSLPPPPAPAGAPIMPMGQPMTPGYAGQTYVGTPMAPQPYQPAAAPFPSPLSRMNLPGAGSLAAGMPPQQHQQPMRGPPHLMETQPPAGPWNPYASDRRPQGTGSQQ